jgi:mRNA-degrading endonuclease RelE of RelBE toxin-antitoxin system
VRWRIAWTKPAMRDMKKLDQETSQRIEAALVRLAHEGHGDVQKLTDVDPPEWRLRVGDYRAFVRYLADVRELRVLRVRKRDQAY